MGNERLDVTGIGNAIVDVLSQAQDSFLEQEGLPKGGMSLIDAVQAQTLYNKMGPGTEVSGGSVANSTVGVASLGGTSGYIGKVASDQLGEVFAHDIRAAGVEFTTAPGAASGPPTARCLVLVTPDAQRTLNTYLGACVELGPEDVDDKLIARSQVTYLEGYLWDPPRAKEAMLKAANVSHEAGQKVSLSLSDGFCVDRHRDEFNDLIDHHVDILFANEQELASLAQTDDFEAGIASLRGRCEVAAVTRGAKGCVVVTEGETLEVPAAAVDKVVDTTGAGDLFAAGFLYGVTHQRSMTDCARLGALSAAEVISHYGARPETSLKDLAASKL